MLFMELKTYLLQERGRLSALAKLLSAHSPDVSRWADGSRPVPIEKCVLIEQNTNGDVTRKDLRPNDWHLIWPELADKEAA